MIALCPLGGPITVSTLEKVAAQIDEPRGVVLHAVGSQPGCILKEDYVEGVIDMAESYRDFVVGFKSHTRPARMTQDFLVITSKVSFSVLTDGEKNQYKTPIAAIHEGADVISVGACITKAKDIPAAAQAYQQAGWNAYLDDLAQP